MPEQARILQFPGRASVRKTPADALVAAREYLSRSVEERHSDTAEGTYRDLDVLLAICGVLRERCNANPAEVFAEAARIFAWLTTQGRSFGYFDERDFFLGESALLAASASRLLGDRSETDLW